MGRPARSARMLSDDHIGDFGEPAHFQRRGTWERGNLAKTASRGIVRHKGSYANTHKIVRTTNQGTLDGPLSWVRFLGEKKGQRVKGREGGHSGRR